MKNVCRKKSGIFVAILMVCALCTPAGYARAAGKISFYVSGNLQSASTAKAKLSATNAIVVIGSTLTLTLKNLDETKVSAIKWKSNRTSIAKVNQKGVVTPVKAGTTTIKCTITYKDKTTQTLSCTVTVKKRVKATAITINNMEKAASIKVGERVTLKSTLSPANTTDQIYWFSSNKAVATVGLTSGKVTAKKEGTVVIMAKAGMDKKGATAKTNKIVREIKIEVKSKEEPLNATDESFFNWRNYGNSITITGYKNDLPKDVVIPEKINGVTVAEIDRFAFSGCSGLESITIPNSVTSIASSAFSYCSGLKKIQVAKGNKVYDSKENSNAIIETKSNCLLRGCENTIILNSVTSIGDYAFSGCSGLTSITLPDSITSIGDSAFRDCSRLTSITLTNGVTSIGDSAFYDCRGLTSITLPDSITSIGDSAFYDCRGLTGITLPNSVTNIGTAAFCGCRGLTSITISNSVTSIGDHAFAGCRELTSIILPDSITSIGKVVFGDCSGLTSITIPNSITSIGNQAFDGCSGLTNITLPDSVISIGDYAFNRCSGLTSIILPDSVTSIGTAAFHSCIELKSITIPNSVTSISDDTFHSCHKLTSITLPDNIISIGHFAFYSCGRLKSIIIPNSVTSIGNQAFAYCYNLTSITIPDSVTSIGDSAFSHCALKIHGQKGSYAQEYAKEHEIPFIEE